MNEIQYIQARIKDLEKCISDPTVSEKLKKNQAQALVMYRLDLKRAFERQEGKN